MSGNKIINSGHATSSTDVINTKFYNKWAPFGSRDANQNFDCRNKAIYYIDTSVLLENIPLVQFIKTTSETRVVYFP